MHPGGGPGKGVAKGRMIVFPVIARMLLVVAALRVSWWHSRLPLDRLPDRLRSVRLLPARYRRPEDFASLVDRWPGRLPPRGLRSCLRRSYLLLDLWSRCGLEPVFYLGVRKVDGTPDGHAWVTAGNLNSGLEPDGGYEPTFVG